MEKIIIHIPHSSTYIPSIYRKNIIVDDSIIEEELIKMTDSYVDVLLDGVNVKNKIIFPISRLICDVERFKNNDVEVMYKKGMGVIYTNLSSGEVFKNIDENHTNEILVNYYDKHHLELENMVGECLAKYNEALIIDAHSFSPIPLQHELNREVPRPDFCLGVDDFHTPNVIVDAMVKLIEVAGYSVKINDPYEGTIVPLKYYQKNKQVKSIMIEVNKRIYMNDQNTLDEEKAIVVKELINNLIISANNCLDK